MATDNAKFEDIIKEIYFQITNVRNMEQDPYYLFISKEVYYILKTEIENSQAKINFIKNGRLDFFEDLEVVPINGISTSYIEVKGIRKAYAI